MNCALYTCQMSLGKRTLLRAYLPTYRIWLMFRAHFCSIPDACRVVMCFTQIAGRNIVLHSFMKHYKRSVEIPATDISECEEVLVVRVCRTCAQHSNCPVNIMQKNLLCFVKLEI